MRVNTLVHFEWDGNAYVESYSEFYEYCGEIARCDFIFGGDTTVEAPQPSEEERALQAKQLELIEQEEADTAALRPFLLQSLGLIEDPALTAEEQTEFDALTAKRDAQGEIQKQKKQEGATAFISFFGAKDKEDVSEEVTVIAGEDFTDADAARLAELQAKQDEGVVLREMTEEEIDSGLTPSELRQKEIQTLTEERQILALKGELPISEAFKQQKQNEWEKFKEANAQKGIVIEGDTPEEGVSTSSPGIQAIRQFNERFDIVEDAQRRGEISQGTANLASITGTISGTKQQEFNNFIGFPGRTAGTSQRVGAAFQPFQFNSQMQFDANQANAANSAANTQALLGGFGSLAGGFLAA